MNKTLQTSIKILFLGFIMVGGISYAAWSAPQGTSTNDNAVIPINEGSTPQIKSGDLGLDGLLVTGGSQIASTSGTVSVGETLIPGVEALNIFDYISGGNHIKGIKVSNGVVLIDSLQPTSSSQRQSLCLDMNTHELITCTRQFNPGSLTFSTEIFIPGTHSGDCSSCTNNSFVVPAQVNSLVIEVWGAGGGGGRGVANLQYPEGGTNISGAGGGGGGGAYSKSQLSVTPFDVFEVVPGAPGTGGILTPIANREGGDGGDSIFASTDGSIDGSINGTIIARAGGGEGAEFALFDSILNRLLEVPFGGGAGGAATYGNVSNGSGSGGTTGETFFATGSHPIISGRGFGGDGGDLGNPTLGRGGNGGTSIVNGSSGNPGRVVVSWIAP
ncbi:hypothetical protein COB64_01380 [Candidatus Wolfebacteria bacterium]|nr:MAG: hypothetical protein COB64_01380 [Candidatus Wolfebacteria bacterium]